jgi:predicted MFS family arabinose efflux permease
LEARGSLASCGASSTPDLQAPRSNSDRVTASEESSSSTPEDFGTPGTAISVAQGSAHGAGANIHTKGEIALPQRILRAEWIPSVVAYVFGATFIISLPLWIAALVSRFGIEQSIAGYVGSVEVGSVSLAMLVTSHFLPRIDRRATSIAAGLVAIVANLVSADADHLMLVVAARCIVGLALGSVLACSLSTAAGTYRPQKTYALMEAGVSIFAILFYWMSGTPIVAHRGLAGIFTLLALTQAAMLPFITLMPRGPARTVDEKSNAPKATVAIWAAVSANGIFYCAMFSFWAFVSLRGTIIGASIRFVDTTLSIAYIASLLVTLAVPIIVNRFGYVQILGWTALLMGICGIALTSTSSIWLFAAAVILLKSHFLLFVPTMNGMYAATDVSGRNNSLGLAAAICGTTIGPALGGLLSSYQGYRVLGVSAFLMMLFCIPALRPQARLAQRAYDARHSVPRMAEGNLP